METWDSNYCGSSASAEVVSQFSDETDPAAGEETTDLVKVNNSYLWSRKSIRQVDGALLVPAEDMFRALSATVTWDPSSMTMTVIHGPRTIRLTARTSTASINGVPFTMSTQPALAKGVLYVPLSFVADALGADITMGELTGTHSVSIKGTPIPPAGSQKAHVRKVIGGDILELDGGLQVRLIGIDATAPSDLPNHGTGFHFRALNLMSDILADADIYLEYDEVTEDISGRQLAYVWLPDGQMINAVLIREGMARVVADPPNMKYLDRFVVLLKEAWQGRRGMWSR